jgi:HK97 gp10 family phage protein
MPEIFDIADQGMAEIILGVQALEKTFARKIASSSLRAGAKILQAAIRRNIHDVSGATGRSVKVYAGKSGKNYKSIQIGIGKKWFTGDEFYAAFVEFGHRQGNRRLGDRRQEVPGEHFMEYAYEEVKDQVIAMTLKNAAEQTRAALKLAYRPQ